MSTQQLTSYDTIETLESTHVDLFSSLAAAPVVEEYDLSVGKEFEAMVRVSSIQ